MRYSLKNTLLAGASAMVLSLGAVAANAGIEAPSGAEALINVDDIVEATTVSDNTSQDDGSIRDNLIQDSDNDSSGISHVQQNNGNANAISAATAVTGERADFSTDPLTVRAETNSETRDNYTNHTGADEQLPDRANRILDSFERFSGIATVQQNNGDHNEIGAATAVAGSADEIDTLDQDSIANSDTHNQQSGTSDEPTALTDNDSDRQNLIDPSFTDFDGIATVQQNNGNANAMSVATSVAYSAGAGDIDQDADANADASNNIVVDNSINRTNRILDSFEGAAGIATVQQNNGDANAMSVATAVAADVDEGEVAAGTIGNPEDINGDTGRVNQNAETVFNESSDITTTDNSTNRSNLIDPSFTDFAGVATVQQNNGSANQMSVANAVIGITGDVSASEDAINQDALADTNGADDLTTIDNSENRENEILDSFNGAKGVVTVQQNNGDANTMNVANAVVGVGGDVTTDSDDGIEQDTDAEFNGVGAASGTVSATDNGSDRGNLIDPSFVGAEGIVSVQQNNGDANTMNVANAVVGVDGDVSTTGDQGIDQDTDADENIVSPNSESSVRVTDNGSTRDNTITAGSFEDAMGVIAVQQNNGDGNTINAATGTVAVGGDVTGANEGILQEVDVDADEQEETGTINTFADADATRNNTISDGSFAGAGGVITVQQNNGSANAISAATGTIAVTGSVSSTGDDAIFQEVDVRENDIGPNVNTFDNSSTRDNTITGSFDGAMGIVTVQQNNGDANRLSVGTAITVVGDDAGGTGDANAATDSDDAVEQSIRVDSNNIEANGGILTDDTGGTRTNAVTDSFNGAMGIVAVQQNNGDANTMNVAVGEVGVVNDAAGDVDQTVDVSDNAMSEISANVDADVTRSNLINPSFQNAAGILTVQQNNGDTNTMNVGVGVVGIGGNVSEEADQNSTSENNSVVNVTATAQANGPEPLSNSIEGGSFNGAMGVITVQQNNGDANTMNSAVAVLGIGGDLGDGADAPDSLDQSVDAQNNIVENVRVTDNGSARSNAITDSFNGAGGVITVQQNNGNANTMNAATGIAGVGGNLTTDLSDVINDSDAENNSLAEVSALDNGSDRDNLINPSFQNATGVITVQQNNGDANTMNAATAVAEIGSVDDNDDPVPGTGDVPDDTEQDTEANSNDLVTIEATDNGSTRNNDIEGGSFNNAKGAITVQQNNGNANTINAATAVAGVQGDVDGSVEDQDEGPARANENTVTDVTVYTASEVDRSNSIDGSFNDAMGTITVQQNNGDANTINAATSVAGVAGEVGGIVDQETVNADDNDVGGVEATDMGSNRPNDITNSFDGAMGTITVQQNDGGANTMNASTSVVGVGGSVASDVIQNAQSDDNDVFEVKATDMTSTRDNDITDSFDGAAGTITVQQNNGDINTINASTAVLSVGSDIDGSVDQTANAGDNDVIGVFAQDFEVTRTNDITDSFVGAAGVATVQQNNGNINTINSASAIAAHVGGSVGGDITQDADAGGIVAESTVIHNSEVVLDPINTISGSFTDFHGVATVQQNNGNANTINAATAVMVNGGADVDLFQDATSSGLVSGAFVDDNLVDTRRNEIINSFNGASGILTVQQNNGDNNVIAASTAVAYSGPPGSTGNADQDVLATGTVAFVEASDEDEPTTNAPDRIGERDNLIDPSFVDAGGVVTAQQNNGSNNVVAAATAVFVDETRMTPADGDEDSQNQTVEARGTITRSVSALQDSQGGAPDPDDRYDRNNRILDSSFDGFQGIATVQQNNGDNNVVAAATGVFAHLGDPNNPGNTDDIDDVEMAMTRTNGLVITAMATDTHGNRRNEIDDSFNASANGAAAGVVTVQQNNGNNNTVLSATGVVANLDSSGSQPHNAVDSEAIGDATVQANTATATELVDRLNTINNSFNGYQGVGTIQQNNGDNNVMGASTQVTVSNNGLNGFGPVATLADLDATVSGNTTIANGFVVGPGYANAITNSFNGAAGVLTSQQNNGSNNAVQSAISVGTNF